MKIKTGDKVIIITGKDKNKTGKVLKTLSDQNKVIVEKINLKWKHIKKTMQKPGQKIQIESPINVSNVMLICPKTEKKTRVSYKTLNNGNKVRVATLSKATIEETNKSKTK